MTEQEEPQNEQPPAVYVGDKELGKYVKAIKYRLAEMEEDEVVARGTFIQKAVDAVEIAKRENDVEVEEIETGTLTGENEDTGEEVNVSTISFTVTGDIELENDSSDE